MFFPRNVGRLTVQQTDIKVTLLATPAICSRISRHQHTKSPFSLKTAWLMQKSVRICAYENIEEADKVNPEVSAFQREEAGRWSRTLVTGRS